MAEALQRGPDMRAALGFSFVSLLCSLGCAGRRYTENYGTGPVLVSTAARPDAPSAAPGGGGMQLPKGNYQLAMWFDTPRAQRVKWRVTCPGNERDGEVGETFEAYRERRLVELNRERERTYEEQQRRYERELEAQAQRRTQAVTVTAAPPPPPPPPPVAARGRVQVGGVVIQGQARVPVPVAPPPPPGTVQVHVAPQPEPAPLPPDPALATPIVELPPGDTGRQILRETIHVTTAGDGTCTVSALADEPLAGTYQVTRLRDPKAEARERDLALRTGAIEVRGRVRAQLVAAGADELARERRRAEHEARLAAEAEARRRERARLQAEADARLMIERADQAQRDRVRLQAEARLEAERERVRRQERYEAEERVRLRLELEAKARWEREAPMRAALEVRGSYVAWLVGTCHADPGRRARLEQERIERERQIALRLEVEREAKLRLRLERERRIALERAERERIRLEREHRIALERAEHERVRLEAERLRLQQALVVRGQITGYLVGLGARLRPPRPAPIFEQPGSAPFDGARWIAGSWEWTRGEWQWRKGGWTDPDRFGPAGGGAAGGEVVVRTVAPPPTTVIYETPAVTITAPPPPSPTITIDVTAAPPPVIIRAPGGRAPVVRDHRPVRRERPMVRQRQPAPRETKEDGKTVRDHRR